MASRFEHFVSGALGTPVSPARSGGFAPPPSASFRVQQARAAGQDHVQAVQQAVARHPVVRQSQARLGFAETAHSAATTLHTENRIAHAQNRAELGEAKQRVKEAQGLAGRHAQAAADALGIPVGTQVPGFLHENKMRTNPEYRAAVEAGAVAQRQHEAAKGALTTAQERTARSGAQVSRSQADVLAANSVRSSAAQAHKAAQSEAGAFVAGAKSRAASGVQEARARGVAEGEMYRQAGEAARADEQRQRLRDQKVRKVAGKAIRGLEAVSAEGRRQQSAPHLSTTSWMR